jgi:hypothetical protein
VHDVMLAASPNPSSLAVGVAASAATSTATATPPLFSDTAAAATSSSGAAATPRRTAAAAAAAASTPQLLFSLKGRPLSASTSIFQAIQAAAVAAAEAERLPGVEEGAEDEHAQDAHAARSRRLWDDVYPIHYAPYTPQAAAAAAASAAPGGSQESVAASLDAEAAREVPSWALPVAPLLAANHPNPLAVPDALQHPLLLLRLVEVMSRLGGRLASVVVPGAALARTSTTVEEKALLAAAAADRGQLVNATVAAKLSRQVRFIDHHPAALSHRGEASGQRAAGFTLSMSL